MKFAIALIAMTMAISANASPAPYIQDVVTYSNPWSLKSSTVWPTYGGLYGKELAVVSDVSYGKYPYQSGYGSWPAYGKSWGYSSPVVAVGAKVVGNGQWNYGGSGYGYGKNWGYSSPVVTVGAKLANNGLWNYGGYGYGLGHNKYWLLTHDED